MEKMKNQKFDFKDITIVPETISTISSRSEISPYHKNLYLPIMVSPMDTVVDDKNYRLFEENLIPVCMPRGYEHHSGTFKSISLDEFETYLLWYVKSEVRGEVKILIDVANGHMKKLHDLCEIFVKNRKDKSHKLMVGNIANPKTYKKFAEMGVDYVRVGIGGGSGCLTSANTGVHYPMASLIHECYQYKNKNGYKTKIVADGGFRNYDDIVKAIMLGADYVMLGGILNKCLESCSTTKLFGIPLSKNTTKYVWENHKKLRKYLKKSFRGMSTKEVQKKWGRETLKTSEGIVKTNPVEYTLEQWVENFTDYLKSAMSYTNSRTLKEFRDSEFVFITENALNRFNK
jgi:IMP dehydrogenase/GMP reductase